MVLGPLFKGDLGGSSGVTMTSRFGNKKNADGVTPSAYRRDHKRSRERGTDTVKSLLTVGGYIFPTFIGKKH